MTSNQNRPTAKIYVFPSGGRAPPDRKRETPTTAYLPQRAEPSERAEKIVYGGSWYHQDAVDEACGR